MAKFSFLLILALVFGCSKDVDRKISSVSKKIYLGELSHYPSELNCAQLGELAKGKALKKCIEDDYYKAVLEENVKCPPPQPDNLLFGSFLLGVSSKAPLFFSFKCGKPYNEAIKELPDKIYFRNKKKNFNTNNEFVIEEGVIWYRPRNSTRPWQHLPLHPELYSPLEIGADSEHFIAVDISGQIFTIKDKALSSEITINDWRKSWGAPLWMGPGMHLPSSRKSWEISFFSPSEDKYYVDQAGNKHGIGVGCTSLYILSDDGQRITYLDPWLPSDLSYEICSPVRGLFQSENLSASGSTIFVINKYGDMYTRNYDFDISGGNDLILNYTYEEKETLKRKGKGVPAFYEPLFTQRVISTTGWERQPKIKGKITNNITVYKGPNKKRFLRVEGEIGNGVFGFFEKEIKDEEWKFTATGRPLEGEVLFNSEEETSHLTLGRDESKRFISKISNIKLEIENFNPYCSPADLKVTFSNGNIIKLKLHSRETVRQIPRERGLTLDPMALNGAIEIPNELIQKIPTLSDDEKEFLLGNLKGRRFTNIYLSATSRNLMIFGQEGLVNNFTDMLLLRPLGSFFKPISATFTWRFKAD